MTERKEVETILTPEGRLINESLFEKDQFDEKATPAYRLEMAFEPDDLQSIEAALALAAGEKWGSGAEDEYYDGKIIDPVIEGDELARRREEKGKAGDAYAGKMVIRAHTIFNLHGQDAPGGVAVFNHDVGEIGPANRQEVYQGCYGQAALVIGTYIDSKTQGRALMFYLQAFQKTRDGDRLVTQRDYTKVFKAVGREEGAGKTRRKSRG